MAGHEMSLLAALTVAWGVLYGYVAVYSFTLHGYRPGERELLPFGIATVGMMFYALGCAAMADAGTSAGAVRAYQWLTFGASVAAAGFMHFAYALANRPIGPAVVASYALSLLSIIANASGLMFDNSLPATPHPMLLQGKHVWLLPTPSLAYMAIGTTSLVMTVGAAWIMRAPTASGDRSERFWLGVTGGVLGISALHDALINLFPVRSVYVLEHCYVLFALAMTHHLFGRVARIDAELARRTQELQESLADLRRTETELAHKEQLAAVGELSAIIVQEVRSPISLIGSALTTLHSEHDTGTNRTAMLDVVDQQSDRLSNLVGDLLTYAKPLHAQITRTPVSQLIERALDTIAPRVRGRTVIDTRIASTPDSLECDPDLLHQALRNLLGDSLPTADTDRRITIETTACDHRGTAGMRLLIATQSEPGDATPQLTGPTTGVQRPGTGLGLAIADRVVRAHQGHLEIRSSAAGSITIILTLPLHVEGTAPVTPSQFPPAAAAATTLPA